MPHLVKRCIDSWKVKNPDWELRIIDAVNYRKYVKLPDLKIKKITAASLSDILRISLLHEYGGVWVDATLYCNKPLDDWLPARMTEGFFAFSKPHPSRLIASWFLAADQHNLIVEEWYAAVIRYWAEKNSADEYFWFHHRFNRIYDSNPDFKRKWDNVEKISAIEPHDLQCNAFRPAHEKHLLNPDIPVHKLTYRIDEKKFRPGTLIWEVLENGPRKKNQDNNLRGLIKTVREFLLRQFKHQNQDACSENFAMLKTGTENLGDHIQIIAGLKLLEAIGIAPHIKIDRDHEIHSAGILKGKKGRFPILLNGWFKTNCQEWPPHPKLKTFYFSFHIRLFQCPELIGEEAIAHYKKWEPIGCRDKYTLILLKSKGVETFLSQCITLSFPRRMIDKERQDRIIVISRDKRILNYLPKSLGNVDFISHYSGSRNFDENMKSAYELLEYYRDKAKLIITTMLHAANPAIAMGIPVVVFYPLNSKEGHQSDKERFSSLADLVRIHHLEEMEEVDWNGSIVNIGMLKFRQRERFYELSNRWRIAQPEPIGPIAPGNILPPPRSILNKNAW